MRFEKVDRTKLLEGFGVIDTCTGTLVASHLREHEADACATTLTRLREDGEVVTRPLAQRPRCVCYEPEKPIPRRVIPDREPLMPGDER